MWWWCERGATTTTTTTTTHALSCAAGRHRSSSSSSSSSNSSSSSRSSNEGFTAGVAGETHGDTLTVLLCLRTQPTTRGRRRVQERAAPRPRLHKRPTGRQGASAALSYHQQLEEQRQ
ncbi:hypothetical protein E2C01_039760 [Portunus trituberculatus]|uniref:Uncharacterized protein n=1 Tax=Portunus trituberculatus TaxID=210409 RepID=A0A5B7FHU7_PORTR|nr:hypothetical protein [Portunus trituberculatus]